MSHRIPLRMFVAILGVLANPTMGQSRAGDHQHPKSNQATPHTIKQAGDPYSVSAIARPSYNVHYEGGYVGGGIAGGGHERCSREGTWGWDYTGPLHRNSHRFLGWSHGRRAQGGTGQYATDGPHPLRHLSESIHERR